MIEILYETITLSLPMISCLSHKKFSYDLHDISVYLYNVAIKKMHEYEFHAKMLIQIFLESTSTLTNI